MKYALIIAPILCASLLCCSDNQDGEEEKDQEYCDSVCEEMYAADIESDACDGLCSVRAILQDGYCDCKLNDCDDALCDARCKEEGQNVGDCNRATDEGMYWGCNCFENEA